MKKALHDVIQKNRLRIRLILFLVLGFIAGSVLAGLLVHRSGSDAIRALDSRYAGQYGRAAETIGKLESELDRQRNINLRLRENNTRARELAYELTGTTERNVRNLQEAITIIGEIRRKLQILEDFYANSNSADSVN